MLRDLQKLSLFNCEIENNTYGKISSEAELNFVIKFYDCLENVLKLVSNMASVAKDFEDVKIEDEDRGGRFEFLRKRELEIIFDDEIMEKRLLEDYEPISKLCHDADGVSGFVDNIVGFEKGNLSFCNGDSISKLVTYFRQWVSIFKLMRNMLAVRFPDLLSDFEKENYKFDLNSVISW